MKHATIATSFVKFIPKLIPNHLKVLSLSVGIACSIGTLLLWQGLLHTEQDELKRVITSRINYTAHSIYANFSDEIMALVRTAKGWELAGPPTYANWAADAQLYLENSQADIQAITWVNPDYQVKWVVPQAGNEAAVDKNLSAEQRRQQALQQAETSRKVVLTAPLDLLTGGKGFLVIVPIFTQDNFQGFIVGAFRYNQSFEPIFDELELIELSTYSTSITDENSAEQIYQYSLGDMHIGQEWSQEIRVSLYNASWKIKVWPTLPLLNKILSPLPQIELGVGLALSWLLSLVCHLAYLTTRREQRVKRLYKELEQENCRRKQAEEELRTTNLQLTTALEKEKELGELKGRFVSTASHEFRTPLTTILSSTEILRYYDAKLSQRKKEEIFERIESAVKRMTMLLNEVLLVAKAQAGKLEFKPEWLNLTKVCEAVLEEFQLSLSDKHTLQFVNPTEEELFGWADEQLLRQVLDNLLSNALKYSPDGGLVKLTLSGWPQGEVKFEVRDQGIGIPLEDQAHLFEDFHRARNVATIAGTGLGLAIVKQAVELHHGTVAVASEVGLGTTFTVILPLKASGTGEKSDSQQPTEVEEFAHKLHR